jgi:uncharacterized Zn finger protein
MYCDHIGHRVFTKRVFSNKTIHYCVQCLNCGQSVKHNGKSFLKLDDIPVNAKIRDFNEDLYKKAFEL